MFSIYMNLYSADGKYLSINLVREREDPYRRTRQNYINNLVIIAKL